MSVVVRRLLWLTAVVIGMTEVLLPFTILPLAAVLARIDINLIHQAQSLGASPAQRSKPPCQGHVDRAMPAEIGYVGSGKRLLPLSPREACTELLKGEHASWI